MPSTLLRKRISTILFILAGILLFLFGYIIQGEQNKVNSAIRQNTLIRSIFVGSDSAVLTLTADGKIETVTPAVLEFTGYSAEELIGQLPEDVLMPEAYVSAHKASYLRAISTQDDSGGQLRQIFCQVQKKDGTTQQVVNTVIWSKEGALAIITPVNQITTRSKLMDIALNLANVGVWWWQVDRDELIWDSRMRSFFEVQEAEVLDYHSFSRKVHPDDLPWVNEVVQKCITDRSEYEAVFRIIKSDGTLRYIRAYGKVFDDPSGTVFAGVTFEVSASEYTGMPEKVGSGVTP